MAIFSATVAFPLHSNSSCAPLCTMIRYVKGYMKHPLRLLQHAAWPTPEKGPQITVSRVGLDCVSHETYGFLSIAKLRSFPGLHTPWLPRTLVVEVLVLGLFFYRYVIVFIL